MMHAAPASLVTAAAFQHPHEATLRKIKAALVRDAFPTMIERYQAESLFGKLLVGGRYDIDNGSKISALFLAYDRDDLFTVQAILWDMFVLCGWPGEMESRFIELMTCYKASRVEMKHLQHEPDWWTRRNIYLQAQTDLMRTAFDELAGAFFARRQKG